VTTSIVLPWPLQSGLEVATRALFVSKRSIASWPQPNQPRLSVNKLAEFIDAKAAHEPSKFWGLRGLIEHPNLCVKKVPQLFVLSHQELTSGMI
jgi:hypothetical protein